MKIAGNTTRYRVVLRPVADIHHRGGKTLIVSGKYVLTGGGDPVVGTEIRTITNGVLGPVHTLLSPWVYRTR